MNMKGVFGLYLLIESIELARASLRKKGIKGTIGEGFVPFPDKIIRNLIFVLCLGVSQSMCPLWCMSKRSSPFFLSLSTLSVQLKLTRWNGIHISLAILRRIQNY